MLDTKGNEGYGAPILWIKHTDYDIIMLDTKANESTGFN